RYEEDVLVQCLDRREPRHVTRPDSLANDCARMLLTSAEPARWLSLIDARPSLAESVVGSAHDVMNRELSDDAESAAFAFIEQRIARLTGNKAPGLDKLVEALGGLRLPAASARLRSFLDDPRPGARVGALRAVGEKLLPDAEAEALIPKIEGLLSDPS